MGDYSIRMQFDIDADTSSVTEALTTAEGIAGWWSDTVDGSPGRSGGELHVAFPDLPERFHFAVERDGDQVSWETQEFPPWWAGTTIRWQVVDHPDVAGSRLSFRHDGFAPDDDIIPVITPAWAAIIQRLKSYAESGTPDPFARN